MLGLWDDRGSASERERERETEREREPERQTVRESARERESETEREREQEREEGPCGDVADLLGNCMGKQVHTKKACCK